MNKNSAIFIIIVWLLLADIAVAQSAPKIPLDQLPTVDDILADYADDPPVVADAKRYVILNVVRRAVSRDMYSRENYAKDPAVKAILHAYMEAEDAILARYGGFEGDPEFDRERRRHSFGFYLDEDGKERGHMRPAEFRLEFFDRQMPSYAAWVREQTGARDRQRLDRRLARAAEFLAPASAVLIVLAFVLAVRGFPRGIVKLSGDGSTMRFGGTPYRIFGVTGEVLEAQKESTTEISGGGGGGTIVDGRGTIRIDPIKSTTTIGDTVFIEDDDGAEHSVKLTDFDLAVRAGNRLSVKALAPRGEDSGWIIFVYNHSTRTPYLQQDVAKQLLRPSFLWLLLTALGLIGAWSLTSLLPTEGSIDFGGKILYVLAAATWIEFFRRSVAALRFRRFKKSAAYRRFVQQIAEEQPVTVATVAVD